MTSSHFFAFILGLLASLSIQALAAPAIAVVAESAWRGEGIPAALNSGDTAWMIVASV